MKITHLTCEYQTNPLGIDLPRPRLSWQIESTRRGARQTAFRVVAAPDPLSLLQGAARLWDTGKVSSDQSIHLPYDGVPLASRQRLYWRVRLWNEANRPTGWSEPACFEMGLLSPADWQAQWIGSAIRGGPRTPASCPYFRKAFSIVGQIAAARLYITALGLYEARLNGQRVGDQQLAPGWSDYHKRVRYQVYDVTGLLRPGENDFGVILGDGWYCGHVGWSERQQYGDRPKLLAQLEITLADGTRQTIITDENWQTAVGPILESDLLMGESYDARLAPENWQPVHLFPQPEGLALVAQTGPPIRVVSELAPNAAPAEIRGWPRSTWIFDLGQNMVGRVRLKVCGPRGATIRLRYGEVLDAQGRLYTENLRTARQTDYYTTAGDPAGETYEPRFTFHGFRYVELTGYPGTPPPDAITGVVLASDNPPTGAFECSDPLVNQLQHNIQWGWRGNSLDVPTDCPQRDERLGWTGDAQVFCRTAAFNTLSAPFFAKWLQDLEDAQGPAGQIPPVAPNPTIRDLDDGGPAWADATIIIPWTMYLCYGDTRLLAERYGMMARFVQFLIDASPNLIRADQSVHDWAGLNKAVWGGFGDWLALDGGDAAQPTGVVGGNTPKDLIGTAFFAYSARLLSQMAAALGKSADAERYQQLYQSVRAAFQNRFVTPDGLIGSGTQTAWVLALAFDLLPAPQRQCAAIALVGDIQRRGTRLSTGFVGTPFLPFVLTEAGRLDVAYQLLLQKNWPSWLYAVTQGATTIWERWDGWTHERGFQDPGMNSFNHYAYGAIGDWLYRVVAGIEADPAQPGYKHILLKPRPGGGLTFAKAEHRSLFGLIKSHWTVEANSLTWEVTVPPNTTTEAHIPAGPQSRILEGGAPIEQAAGLKFLRRDEQSAVFELLPGVYRFTVEN